MSGGPTDAATASGPHEVRLGLLWRAILIMVGVLGVAHAVYGVWLYDQLNGQHQRRLGEALDEAPRVFSALQQQNAQSLSGLALQLMSLLEFQAGTGEPPDFERIQTFGGFTALELFAKGGRSIAAWDAPGSERPSGDPAYERAVQAVLTQGLPTSLVSCRAECTLYALVPTFDADGRELAVAIGQPLAETLFAFQRLTGTDVGLLHARPPASLTAAASRLWGHPLSAVTNAPALAPLLESLPDRALPPAGTAVETQAGKRSLRLQIAAIEGAVEPDLMLLLIADETAQLAEIRRQLSRSVALNVVTLLLSCAAVYFLLTPALRRLAAVTRALPLLAERRFEDSRRHLALTPRQSRSDEIDMLRRNALALSYRLEALDHAEAASEEKSRFLATMSHEIRTPMNGVLGLLELLERDSLGENQRNIVRIARESGRTLLRVIDDILDFSRMEAGQLKLEHIAFAPGELIEDAVETLAPGARSKGLRLTTFVDPALPPLLIGDPLRLRQILFNLCSNAIKFTASGSVHVRAEPLSGAAPGSRRLRLSVIDSGEGLRPEARQRLFKPFTQADSSTTRRFGGTGLGLSIVHGLVTQMGGVVDYSSAEGRGSHFWCDIEFPLAAAEAAGAATPSPVALAGVAVAVELPTVREASDLLSYLIAAGADVAASGDAGRLCLREAPDSEAHLRIDLHRGGRIVDSLLRPVSLRELVRRLRLAAGREVPAPRPSAWPAGTAAPTLVDGICILVAEDHPVNQQVTLRQLQQLGYAAEVANDGAEALQKLARRDYAALLADLHMPGMDGLQLARAVREAESQGQRAGHLPIYALTAAAVSGERELCLDAGMDGFLLKPIGLDALRKALDDALRQRSVPVGDAAPPAAAATPAPTPTPHSVIDLAELDELVGGDQTFAEHLMREFLRINTPTLAQLREQIEDGADGSAIRALAHRLLGSARTLAAGPLAAVLADLERAAEAKDAAAFPALGAEVEQAFEQVRAFIASRQV